MKADSWIFACALGALGLVAACVQTPAAYERAASQGRLVSEAGETTFVPDSGFVADSATAIALARVYLVAVVGSDAVREQEPLSANLTGDVWTVVGHLPPNFVGGVARLRLARRTGAVVGLVQGL